MDKHGPINKIVFILKFREKLLMQNYINLIKINVTLKNSNTLKYLVTALKCIHKNFISFLLSSDFILNKDANKHIAYDILCKNISYNDFIKAMQYYIESFIDVLVSETNGADISKCLPIINEFYSQTIYHISEEYFNYKDSTIFALAKLAELRDDSTGMHLERTKEYAVLLAKALGVCENFIRCFERASLLHDIGKVGIKDSILLKSGRLTKDEFEEMKKHTLIGADTINQIIIENNASTGYLVMAKSIALFHHEKYDGSGYPYGLKGNNIPLCARIFSLADAYDAMVSKRPYKEAVEHNEAVKRILRDSNKHFDPEVVQAFLTVQNQFKEISTIYHESGKCLSGLI